jgi:hypothetical protein
MRRVVGSATASLEAVTKAGGTGGSWEARLGRRLRPCPTDSKRSTVTAITKDIRPPILAREFTVRYAVIKHIHCPDAVKRSTVTAINAQ